MAMVKNIFITLFAFNALLATGHAASVLENIKEIRSYFGLDKYEYRPELAKLKIAVIDNGFNGFESGKKQLPDSAELIAAYPKEMITQYNLGDPEYVQAPAPTEHGKIMAQIVWGVTGSNPQGPKFYLLNANGITNFKRAVRFAIQQKVDIILYSQNRECCGSFDGGGFINSIVNDATRAGVVWINAAGNYGGHVFNSSIQSIDRDGTVTFQQTKELRLKSRLDENKAQIILTWNAGNQEEDAGTDQDLDLYVYDENNKELAKSELKQVLNKKELGEGETFLARERISHEFSKNRDSHYRIVVKAKSRNFNSYSKVRIVVIPERPPIQDNEKQKLVDAIEFLDATKGEEIMVPADNPSVITVGDISSFSAQGPTMDGRVKPEIVLENSVASFSNGQSSTGTSNAAAYFAGIVAVLKSHAPGLTRQQIISFPKKRPSTVGASIRRTNFTELVSQHGAIFNTVEELLEESPILAGMYPDGRYAIGIRKDPREVLQPICGNNFNPQEQTEFFLSIEQNYDRNGRNNNAPRIQCYTRKVPTSGNENSPYPWERSRMPSSSFVEVRQVFLSTTQFPSQGIWQTPNPQDL